MKIKTCYTPCLGEIGCMQEQVCFPMIHQIPVYYIIWIIYHYIRILKCMYDDKQPEVKDDLPFWNLQMFS